MKIPVSIASALLASSLSAVTLDNGSIAIHFDGSGHGFALTGIVNKVAGAARFVTAQGKKADFWELRFTGGPGGVTSIHNHSPSRRSMRPLSDGGAVFTWSGLSLPGASMAVDVEAKVCFNADGASVWTIAAVNRATNGWALAYTSYPYLRGVLSPGEGDALVPSKNLGGRFIRGFVPADLSPQSYNHPSWFPMVTAFHRGDAGLYVAAHDRESRIKTLFYENDGSMRFETPVENAGVAGKAAEGPRYPVVIAAYKGDWWQTARRYRKFAMTCPWTAKGPIAHRADFPKAMADTAVWCALSGTMADASNQTAWVRARWPDLKIGMHWYDWHLQPKYHSDACYPEFLPRPGVAEHIAEYNTKNIVLMPYVNGRLWDSQLMSYQYAVRDACMREDGTPHTEAYGKGFAVMCPACPMWQDVLLRMGTNVVEGLGAPAIYYDQVTCSRPKPCFNPAHGHPLGGGTWWADGYRKAFSRLHERFSARNVPITSEGAAETWLDVVDGHLICGRGANPDDVPFLPAVYSGYTVYFGMIPTARAYYNKEFVAYVARATLWGCATGRWGYTRFFKPDMPDSYTQRICTRHSDAVAALARVRMAAADFLVYGHLEDELRPIDPPQKTVLPWCSPRRPRNGKNALQPLMLEQPAVMGTVWRDVDDSRKAVFAANVSDSAQTVRFRMPQGCGNAAVFDLPGFAAPKFSESDGVVTLTIDPDGFVGVTAKMELKER